MRKPAKFRHTFLGLAILACLGIWYFLVRIPYTRNEPKESDLVGVYRPDFKRHFSFFKFSNFPPTNSEIRVETGGKIKLVNVVDWLEQGDTNSFGGTRISTNGSWHLEKSEDHWLMISDYTPNGGNMTMYFQLVGEKPPYRIRIHTWETGTPFYFVQGTN